MKTLAFNVFCLVLSPVLAVMSFYYATKKKNLGHRAR